MIRGHRVGLRAIERSDLPCLLAWRNDPKLRRFFREVRELSSDHQDRWYDATVLKGEDRTRMFAIVEVGTQALLGAAGLTTLDWLRRHGEFSLYIGRDGLYCDEIFAPEAAGLLLAHGFEDLGLHRIWAEVYDFDTPKQRLLDGLGMRREGCLRDHHFSDGRFWDAHLFGTLAKERIYAAKPALLGPPSLPV